VSDTRGATISFSVKITLTESDWDKRVGGWKCDALAIPGSRLADIFFGGRDVTPRSYKVVEHSILWTTSPRPKEIVVTIVVDGDLSEIGRNRAALEVQKSDLEREKFALEQAKFKSEKRWKLYSALGAILSAFITAVTTTQILPESVKIGAPKAAAESATIGLTRYYEASNDFLATGGKDSFAQLLKDAKHDVWFFGTSFYISIDQYRDHLLSKLGEGININFLVLDCESSALNQSAAMLDTPITVLGDQCRGGLRNLAALVRASRKSGNEAQLKVKLIAEPLASRIYFFDPRTPDGKTYYVPQVNGISSQKLPGFVVHNKIAKFHNVYFLAVQRLWNGSDAIDFAVWSRSHPELDSVDVPTPGKVKN
jgi:hypothetical protein